MKRLWFLRTAVANSCSFVLSFSERTVMLSRRMSIAWVDFWRVSMSWVLLLFLFPFGSTVALSSGNMAHPIFFWFLWNWIKYLDSSSNQFRKNFIIFRRSQSVIVCMWKNLKSVKIRWFESFVYIYKLMGFRIRDKSLFWTKSGWKNNWEPKILNMPRGFNPTETAFVSCRYDHHSFLRSNSDY